MERRFPIRSSGGNRRPVCVLGERHDLLALLGSAVLVASRLDIAKSRRVAGTLHFPDPYPPDSHPLTGMLS